MGNKTNKIRKLKDKDLNKWRVRPFSGKETLNIVNMAIIH